MVIIIEDRNWNQIDEGSKVSREFTWCSGSPFNLCFLCMYWQVTVTVNMHMHSRPTEQISTAHRYTSETQKVSPAAHWASWLMSDSTQKCEGEKKRRSTCFAELFKVLYYILWVGLFLPAKDDTVPVHHKHTHTRTCTHTTHTNSNTLKNKKTYLQTSSTGSLWPWWPVEHALHEGRQREERHVMSAVVTVASLPPDYTLATV